MRKMSLVAALLMCAVSAFAEDALPAYAFSVAAQPGENREVNHIRLAVGVGGIHAIRVYSEPSHTLLAAFVDLGDGDFSRQPWFAGLLPPKTRQVLVASLKAGMKGTLQAPLPAAGDTHLVIHTRRPNGNGGPASDDTLKVTVPDLRHFGFALEAYPTSEPPPGVAASDVKAMVWMRYKFRCGIEDGCGTAEFLCAVNEATCCWVKEEYDTCGWCGRMRGYCGTTNCPGCSPY